ncbi:NAD(+) diphosphatase [Glaciecola sp. SC05]|uniref:NAD(+) diphosphatase n=1 Tax=Glaciecola sp. SC05 TaxID=1987355 RepID=UPI003529B30C
MLQKLHFIFSNNRLLVPKDSNLSASLEKLQQINVDDFSNYLSQGLKITESTYGEHILIDMQKEQFVSDDYHMLSLREALGMLSIEEFAHVAQAWQYAIFLRHHKYCGRCGSGMQQVQWEMAMHCHRCQHRVYPRVSPCIIVSVRKGDKILLAQGVRHQSSGFFSTLAGFVESAESLETAVHREVKEEVGIDVKNIEYFGSQPWPFPHSLMVGYLADYAGGDLVLEEKEILSADWFDIDDLPNIPPKLSIAGRLIEETVKRIRQEKAN